LRVSYDARPATLAAAEEELAQKKRDFDSSQSALAAALQSAFTARRCVPSEAACKMVSAHSRFFVAGAEFCAPMDARTSALLTALHAERSASAAHVPSPSRPAGGPRHRRTPSAGQGALSGDEGESSATADEPTPASSSGPLSQRVLSQHADVLKQGYLLKLSSSLYGDWKRRYFVVTASGELHYFRDAQASKGVIDRLKALGPGAQAIAGAHAGAAVPTGGTSGGAPVTLSLLTSAVKANAEAPLHTHRFCFRVVSPQRTLTLQAENAGEQKQWMEAITNAIADALSAHSPGGADTLPRSLSPAPPNSSHHARSHSGNLNASALLEELYTVPGNDACCDCGAEWPEWGSLNLTILLCLRCSGVHRSLGVHVSKVRSLTLDVRAWDPSMLACFAAGGNAAVNAVLEAQPGARMAKPGPESPHDAVHSFAKAKYCAHTWLRPQLRAQSQNHLSAAVAAGDVSAALAALLAGASASAVYTPLANGVEEEAQSPTARGPDISPDGSAGMVVSSRAGRTLLHVAASAGCVAMAELLMQWGAAVDARDGDGRSPLYLACRAAASDTGARALGGAQVAVRLLSRGADPGAADRKGRTPAMLAAHARDEALHAALLAASQSRHGGGLGPRTHSL